MLNPDKIWREYPTDLSISPVWCCHFTSGNPKKSFFDIIIHIHVLQIIYVSSEKKQGATVVQQLELFTHCCSVLAIICIALVLRLSHATGGARVLIWTCWGLRQRLVATWAEFQHSVVYCATELSRGGDFDRDSASLWASKSSPRLNRTNSRCVWRDNNWN